MGIFGNDEKKYHDKAGDYFKKGDFEKAIEYLDNVLEINPNSVNALNDKGITLKNIGRFDEALKYYDKVLEIEPDHITTLLNKANILMDNFKDYKEAIYYYNESLKIDPENLKALNGKKLAENELNNIKNNSHPNYNTQINNEMNFCPKCGTKSVTGAEFCYKCGAKLIHDNVVGNINTSTNGSGNENFNYQNTEKQLIKINEPKKFKHPLTFLLDAITDISVYIFIVSLVGIIISFIIAFIDQKLFRIIINIVVIPLIISMPLIAISAVISDRLKGSLRQKIIQTGIPAQARVLKVTNLEYSHHQGIRTAELILEVDPETDAPYQVKSTVRVGVSDASLIFRPGSTVKVFVDPEDASQVEVEY